MKKASPAKSARAQKKPATAKSARIQITHDLTRDALKTTTHVVLGQDARGRLWAVCVEGAITVYRFDGDRATRFEFPDGVHLHSHTAFAAAGDAVWFAAAEAVHRFDGDTVTELPRHPAGRCHALATIGDRLIFVPHANTRTSIDQLDGSTWRPFATGFDNVRQAAGFRGGLVVTETDEAKVHVIATDGKRTELAMYREGSRIVCGETRFATYSDSLVEVRDPDGREVARLDGDTISELVGWYPDLGCAARLAGDELVVHVRPRGGKGPGALVRHHMRTGKTAVHAHSDRLVGKYAPDEMVLDPTGALWMNHSGEGKTLVYVLPPDGKLVTLKR